MTFLLDTKNTPTASIGPWVPWSHPRYYIEDITWWREDMNFIFEWQEQYLTSERSEGVRYCSCHENIKFISSSQRVMFFLLYGETSSTKAKGGNRDVIEQIRHSQR